MFGLGVWEFALILVVALLVLGPERLPKVARTLGRGMRELRKAMSDFQTNLNSVDIDERREERKPSRFPPPPGSPPQSPGSTSVPTESQLSASAPHQESTAHAPVAGTATMNDGGGVQSEASESTEREPDPK